MSTPMKMSPSLRPLPIHWGLLVASVLVLAAIYWLRTHEPSFEDKLAREQQVGDDGLDPGGVVENAGSVLGRDSRRAHVDIGERDFRGPA